MDDTRPFPIQSNAFKGHRQYEARSTIPWWLAEEGYKYYVERFGDRQTLEEIAQRGGFGRQELLMLLRREI